MCVCDGLSPPRSWSGPEMWWTRSVFLYGCGTRLEITTKTGALLTAGRTHSGGLCGRVMVCTLCFPCPSNNAGREPTACASDPAHHHAVTAGFSVQ